MGRACLVAGVVLAGCGGGETLSLPGGPGTLKLTSTEIGGMLDPRFTCDGAGLEPRYAIRDIPPATQELVVIVSDPDAPGGTFFHLTGYRNMMGTNSAGRRGWTPPCPPRGDAAHRYVWTVYALRRASGLKAGAEPRAVMAAIRAGGVLARGTLTARYQRR